MGAPKGPRLKPKLLHDDEGQYLVFTGKHCSAEGCGLLLTSRNRHGQHLLCLDHGREKERERDRQRYKATKEKAKAFPRVSPAVGTDEHIRIADASHRRVHAALSRWLAFPTDAEATEALHVALNDHELRARLRELLPWVPSAQAIPVEAPSFTNPNHRSTRLEFLADADHYQV